MVEQITLARPRVDPGLILKLQKYRKIEAVSPVVRETAARMAALAETLVGPRAWRARGRLTRVEPEGSVLLAGGLAFHSRVLARRLAQATEVAIVLLTVGPELERRAQEMIRDGQFVEGLLLDTAGWVVIEVLIKDIRRHLAAEARAQDLRLTGRMAPGFGDWGLEQQRALFSAFDGAGVSVRLTEACVMLPLKSVSGLYGLVPLAAR
ncbi:MAG: hypothetical protein QME77_03930 [bacterium]|nr:hypothetical protein [bacterium]